MIDIFEIMKLFNLDAKPYLNTGLPWSCDGSQVYFVEDNCMYSVIAGEDSTSTMGFVCAQTDVQQFLGWEYMIFSAHMQEDFEFFEKKYLHLM